MNVMKETVRDYTVRHQDPMKSVFRTLTHYLQHQRWIWTIQANAHTTVPMEAVSRMLATLTK